jgi:hypothetical protein
MIITEHDALTGETIEREATSQELDQMEAFVEDYAVQESEKAARAQMRLDLLDRLGITQDEAKLLLG